MRTRFDPLVEFEGKWTTELAERHLPIEGMPQAKYECWDGNLVVTPCWSAANSYAMAHLGAMLIGPMEQAGYPVYGAVNMMFNRAGWIEPDVAVLRQPVGDVIWVPAELVLMPVEFVWQSIRNTAKIDRPAHCAAAGVPYFMRVDVRNRNVHVELLRLNDGGSYALYAKADLDEVFRTDLPTPFSFGIGKLLDG